MECNLKGTYVGLLSSWEGWESLVVLSSPVCSGQHGGQRETGWYLRIQTLLALNRGSPPWPRHHPFRFLRLFPEEIWSPSQVLREAFSTSDTLGSLSKW